MKTAARITEMLIFIIMIMEEDNSTKKHALVVAQFRLQYHQYFWTFSYFADEKRGKYWLYCAI